jgi:uncharacterized protein
MSTELTRVSCNVVFTEVGKQTGYLGVTHSDNRHAYGLIPVPIVCIANGYGPTVLVTAGNHGDEHEGIIIARHLINTIEPLAVRGRIIVIPALNYPAVLEDSRVSPLDNGNMNRAYPGSASGTPTFAIAHYVETVLLPMCDAALDLHSGGKVSEFLPCTFLVKSGTPEFLAAKVAAIDAFGAPTTTVVSATADGRSLSAAADRQGVLNIATELAGGGTVSLDALRIGTQGTLRWLAHVGVLNDVDVPAPEPSRYIQTRDRSDFAVAPMDGLFEPRVRLGDVVETGQLAGLIHPIDDPARASMEVYFNASGTVICRRVPARTRRGDYVFHIGECVDKETLLATSTRS